MNLRYRPCSSFSSSSELAATAEVQPPQPPLKSIQELNETFGPSLHLINLDLEEKKQRRKVVSLKKKIVSEGLE